MPLPALYPHGPQATGDFLCYDGEMHYQPSHCVTCGKDIFPHWKYCQEHTKNNILLDMDVNKFGVPLCKQENDRVWAMLENEMKEHALLKEQYEKLQYNYELLYRHGFEKFIEKQLSTHRLT